MDEEWEQHASDEEELGFLPIGGGSGVSVVGGGAVDGGADALREREREEIVSGSKVEKVCNKRNVKRIIYSTKYMPE